MDHTVHKCIAKKMYRIPANVEIAVHNPNTILFLLIVFTTFYNLFYNTSKITENALSLFGEHFGQHTSTYKLIIIYVCARHPSSPFMTFK